MDIQNVAKKGSIQISASFIIAYERRMRYTNHMHTTSGQAIKKDILLKVAILISSFPVIEFQTTV